MHVHEHPATSSMLYVVRTPFIDAKVCTMKAFTQEQWQ